MKAFKYIFVLSAAGALCACSDLLDDEETLRELTEMPGEEQEEYFRKADEEALRAQVRDFIDWLETEGVLAS